MQDFLNKHPWLARVVRLRMADWVVTALVLWALVAVVAPMQLQVSLYKMALVALAAVAGFWIDRSLFPYARPDLYFELMRPLAPLEKSSEETTFTALGGVLSFAEQQAAESLQGMSLEQLSMLARAAMVRRAVIVAATMLAVCLGA